MTWLRRLWVALVDPPHSSVPRRPAIVLAMQALDPAVESEMGKAMRPVKPVRHQLRVVHADWWLRTYAPDHERSA